MSLPHVFVHSNPSCKSTRYNFLNILFLSFSRTTICHMKVKCLCLDSNSSHKLPSHSYKPFLSAVQQEHSSSLFSFFHSSVTFIPASHMFVQFPLLEYSPCSSPPTQIQPIFLRLKLWFLHKGPRS